MTWLCFLTSWQAAVALIIIAALILNLVNARYRRRGLKHFASRGCAVSVWRTRFPQAALHEISEFLELFGDAFSLPRRIRLSFQPDDKLMDVYRALRPWRGMPDEMEFESLAVELEDRYRLDLSPNWREDLSLGDVFALTQGRANVTIGAQEDR